jgi:hypothetical protein
MPLQQATLRSRLADRDTFATTLLVIAIDTYWDVEQPKNGAHYIVGNDRWAPETIIAELEDDYNVRIPRLNQDKLFMAINLVTSDDFFKRPRRFVDTCNVLSGSELSRAFDKADAMECAWGMTEALLICPPDEDEPFNPEIRHYLGKVLDDEGIREPPDLLRLALRDTLTGNVDYSDMPVDDPEAFSMMYEVQADRSLEIKEMLERELLELFEELKNMPLKHGNTENLLKRIQGRLQADD